MRIQRDIDRFLRAKNNSSDSRLRRRRSRRSIRRRSDESKKTGVVRSGTYVGKKASFIKDDNCNIIGIQIGRDKAPLKDEQKLSLDNVSVDNGTADICIDKLVITNNSNGEGVYVPGNCITIDFVPFIKKHETITTLVKNNDGSYTYVNEEGTSTTIEGLPATADTVNINGCDPVINSASLVDGTLTIDAKSEHRNIHFGSFSVLPQQLTPGQTSTISTKTITNPSSCRKMMVTWIIRSAMDMNGGANTEMAWRGELDLGNGFDYYHNAFNDSYKIKGVADWGVPAYGTTSNVFILNENESKTLRLRWSAVALNNSGNPIVRGGIYSQLIGVTL